jgi:hypothetical protein
MAGFPGSHTKAIKKTPSHPSPHCYTKRLWSLQRFQGLKSHVLENRTKTKICISYCQRRSLQKMIEMSLIKGEITKIGKDSAGRG